MFWLRPTYDGVDDTHAMEARLIEQLNIQDVTPDPFGPALYERREDAERVKAAIEKEAPKLRIQLMG